MVGGCREKGGEVSDPPSLKLWRTLSADMIAGVMADFVGGLWVGDR